MELVEAAYLTLIDNYVVHDLQAYSRAAVTIQPGKLQVCVLSGAILVFRMLSGQHQCVTDFHVL